MRRLSPVTLLILATGGLALWAAQEPHQHTTSATGSPKGAQLLPGMGSYHHPIATKNAQAQRFFDQGLTLVFGFNHTEAIRSFETAAALDPQAVMPLWGIAYALGPNINMPVSPENEKKAYETIQKALALAEKSPQNERDYVQALAKRYSGDAAPDLDQLAVNYSRAMKELTRLYPDDVDAATLYAESMMDLRPWRLYDLEGNPAEDTEEIVAVLESVLKRYPTHPGANHYYIHAVEASKDPQKALPSANTLQTLVPGAGHLVHMPAHIYARTGDYSQAADSNAKAADVDRQYLKTTGTMGSLYSLMYYGHNLHFLAYAATQDGRQSEAQKAAADLVVLARPALQEMPMIEFALPTPLFVELRFQNWSAIANSPEPSSKTPTTRALWRFFRGMALASQGKAEPAQSERQAFRELAAQAPKDLPYSGTGFSTSGEILAVAGFALDARIASAQGNHQAAIESWEKAVKAQDQLAYDEPPAWFYSLRESLGGEYFRAGQFAEAEKIFREDLDKHPRSPRSLVGLMESLKAQGKDVDASWVARQFKIAWKGTTAPTAASL
jgi:tetratricopeptide (TPR) repeat protein